MYPPACLGTLGSVQIDYKTLGFLYIAFQNEEIWYFSVAVVKCCNQFALNQRSQACRRVHSAPINDEETHIIFPDIQAFNTNAIVAAMLL